MKHLLLFLTFLSSSLLIAQSGNLIPNSSFEKYKKLPDDVAQGRQCLAVWTIPNSIGAGDYYHAGCPNKKAGTPKNHFGKQEPRTGKAYMGLCMTKDFREYLQVKLRSTLVKNKRYKIVAYVSCGDKAGLSQIDEFNALFSAKSFKVPNNEDLQIVPKVKFTGDFSNKKEWLELSTLYKASGGEQYLTFGSFTYVDNGVKHGEIQGVSKYAHYFIDDISLTLIEDSGQIVPDDIIVENPKSDSIANYKNGEIYAFDKLLFESGKSVLLGNDYPEVEELIQYLKTRSQYKLLITGHTDNVGDEAFNQKLSYDRANSLKSFLVKNGINSAVISIKGKGDTEPLMSNDTEEGRKINRRVEISISQ
ncbi:MAG: OOP family OmpA-OmpF porin [Arenicella sp.]|jgi:OOP family OmpA-OmpF porin